MTPQKIKCIHKANSCKECSRLKMTVYLKNGSHKVWYSFIKEDHKITTLEGIKNGMLKRAEKFYGSQVSKILFYDNKNVDCEAIFEE